MTNGVICLLFFKADEYACGSGSDWVWGGEGAQKSMLNNGITSLTCIHREAGIKPYVEGGKKKTEKKEEGKEGKEDGDESEVIKKRSAAYLLKK